ncbi:MAG: hypothetical protein ABEH43_05265, partial [Flavobacteriales bacterium]
VSMGRDNRSTAEASFTMGVTNQAKGINSAAIGLNNVVAGDRAMAFGNDLRAPSWSEVAVGAFNTFYVPTSATSKALDDRVFSVGIGSSGARENAMVIKKSGWIGIGRDMMSSPSLVQVESDTNVALHGASVSTNSTSMHQGVVGTANNAERNHGVAGYANTPTSSDTAIGVFGRITGSGVSGAKAGVFGNVELNGGKKGVGVAGEVVQTDASVSSGIYKGGDFSAFSAGGSDTAIGVLGEAVGASTNYAGYFPFGNVRIDDSLGVGVSSPEYKAHIVEPYGQVAFQAGTDNSTFASIYINARTSGANPGYGYKENGILTATHRTYSGDWRLRVSGNDYLTVTQTGLVGIGTNFPGARLNVKGDIEVPVSNDYKYETPKTHYKSVHPMDFDELQFSGANNPRSMAYDSLGVFFADDYNSTGDGWIEAPIHLPDGATITKIQFYVVDYTGPLECSLYKNNTKVLSATSSGVGSEIVEIYPSMNVDNLNNLYSLRVYFSVAPELVSNLRVEKAVIHYEVNKAD